MLAGILVWITSRQEMDIETGNLPPMVDSGMNSIDKPNRLHIVRSKGM